MCTLIFPLKKQKIFFKFTEFTAEAKYGIESGKKDKNHPQYNLLRTLRQKLSNIYFTVIILSWVIRFLNRSSANILLFYCKEKYYNKAKESDVK